MPHKTLEEELLDIEELEDPKVVKDKRSSRKGVLTRLNTYLQTQQLIPLGDTRIIEFKKKLAEVQRSSALYDALYERYIELCRNESEFKLESELMQAEASRQENEVLVEQFEVRLELATLYNQGDVLRETMSDFRKLDNYSTPSSKATLENLHKKLADYRRDSGPYKRNSTISELRTELGDLLQAISTDMISKEKELSSTEPTSTSTARSKIKINLPTFSGQPLDWKDFFQLFEVLLKRDHTLVDDEKACLLINAMGTTEAKQVAQRAAAGENRYASAVAALKQAYGQDRAIYPSHVHALLKKKTYGYTRKDMRELREHWTQHIRGLKRCDGQTWSQILAAVLEGQLDPTLAHEWSVHSASTMGPPTVEQMLDFITAREASLPTQQEQVKKPQSTPSPQQKSKPQVLKVDGQQAKCPACQEEYHALFRCSTFQSWEQNKRYKFVKNNNLCSNCLGKGHAHNGCPSKRNCRVCDHRHHTMLHRDSSSHSTQQQDVDGQPTLHARSSPTALLSTAIAKVYDGQRQQMARILLDSGASLTLITEKLASSLQARRHPQRLSISGLSGGTVSKNYVNLTFCSAYSSQDLPQDKILIKCHVVPKLPIINTPANAERLLQLPCIKGRTPIADPHLGGSIDVLLGISDCSRCSRGDTTYSADRATLATKTIFGWTLGGAIPDCLLSSTVLKATGTEDITDALLQRFWEQEQVPTNSSTLTADEEAAVSHFKDTYQILPNGRFAVQLPRRSPLPELGESRSIAVRRFLQNERVLQKKGQLTEFRDVLQEYGTLGHAEQVPRTELIRLPSSVFYMPTHGVTKEMSTTTKLRAVFDASAKSKSGHSLNDQLLSGPNLYPLLTTILNRFRMHAIAVSADISKMFREIVLQSSERDYHRFIQRNSNGELTDWRMKRLTFGVASSPFVATQVLRQLAINYKDQYPQAAAVIESSFYVDDCFTGAQTVTEATALKKQLYDLLQKAGMTLRKWRSNSQEFLQTVPSDLQEQGDLLISDPSGSIKALGLHWDIKADNFHVSVPSISDEVVPTKRLIASSAAKVFDVLGWYSPVVLKAKLILQQLWTLNLSWDEPIPEDFAQHWRNWSSQLNYISENAIPRQLFSSTLAVVSRQLHGFADASSLAYGGVVYMRVVFSDTKTSVTIITAKTRVAPLKTLTIPKLELCAALLTAKLLHAVASDFNMPTSNVYAWSDSSITLGWIHKAPGRWKTFVANRVTEIQNLIPSSQWRYVPTQTNPADHASRGLLPRELLNCDLWWQGPAWLSCPPTEWPPPLPLPLISDLPEVRATITVMKAESKDDSLWRRYSSFTTLLRTIAWCRRFIYNARHRADRKVSPTLTSHEIASTRQQLYRLSQEETYADVLHLLRSGKILNKTNPLFCLSPYLAPDQILRVGGRLQQSREPTGIVHPIILSVKSLIARLMVQTLHTNTNHSGPSTMLAILAENFYIAGVKRLCKAISRSCVACQRAYARTMNQQMGRLPPERLRLSPPFHHVGIDFAGPFLTKRGNPRKPVKVKSYACLFVCLVTKAVHIEICSELSTDAFLATFSRFCARRGTPACVFSDNGTNFHGAAHMMEEAQQLLHSKTTQQRLSHLATHQQIEWNFSPSCAPHFGGLWEAGIRGMKAVLRKLLSSQVLTFEELATVLAEAEATLNSRPLLPLDSTETDGLSALTPGHLLIGRPLKAPPMSVNVSSKITLLRRWNLMKRLGVEVWSQWRSRYLQALQARSKWQSRTRNFRKGDIVLLKDDTLTQRTWPLAIILSTSPGSDGLVRVVNVRCLGNVYRRTTNRLVLLVPATEDQPRPPGVCPGLLPVHEHEQ